SGDDTAVNISGSDSGVALALNPVWGDRMAATVTDTVVADKLEIAGAVSQPGMLKIDPEILQLDGLDAANALVMTNGTGTETINLSRHYSLDDSGDGRGDKIAALDPRVSAAGETSVQSVAENGCSASNPFTETPNGNGNHSAFNFDNFKFADDNSVHPGKASVPAQHNDKSSPAVADKDDPAHPHDKFKFADEAAHDSAPPRNQKSKHSQRNPFPTRRSTDLVRSTRSLRRRTAMGIIPPSILTTSSSRMITASIPAKPQCPHSTTTKARRLWRIKITRPILMISSSS